MEENGEGQEWFGKKTVKRHLRLRRWWEKRVDTSENGRGWSDERYVTKSNPKYPVFSQCVLYVSLQSLRKTLISKERNRVLL